MATFNALYNDFLREIRRTASDTRKADFVKWTNLCSQDIQEVARVEEVWDVTYTASTEVVTVVDQGIYKLRDVRFRPTGTEDKLHRWLPWQVLPQFDDDPEEDGLYLFDETLYIPRPPTTGGTLRLRGEKTLSTITTAEIDDAATKPLIPAQFHDVYVWFAASNFGAQRQDFGGGGRFANFRALYNERREALDRHYNRTRNRRTVVKIVRGWY